MKTFVCNFLICLQVDIFCKVGETLKLLSAWDIRSGDCQILSSSEEHYVPTAEPLFQQNDKLTKATNTKPYLQNILYNLEEKQISDQKVLMRKVNSGQKKGFYCSLCLLSFESIKNLNKHNEEHFTRRNSTLKCLLIASTHV